jgi:hypothetical protein
VRWSKTASWNLESTRKAKQVRIEEGGRCERVACGNGEGQGGNREGFHQEIESTGGMSVRSLFGRGVVIIERVDRT